MVIWVPAVNNCFSSGPDPVLPRVVDAVEFFLEDEGDGESLRDLKLRKLCFLKRIWNFDIFSL